MRILLGLISAFGRLNRNAESKCPMLGNTLTINDGASRVLVKVNGSEPYSSEYCLKDPAGLFMYRAQIRHTTTKATPVKTAKDRHNFEIVKTVFAVPGVSPEVVTKFYFVMEQESNNSNVALADSVADLMIASTNSFLLDLLQYQS